MTTFNTMILSPVISKLAARLVNVHTTFAAMSAGVCDILPLVAILQLDLVSLGEPAEWHHSHLRGKLAFRETDAAEFQVLFGLRKCRLAAAPQCRPSVDLDLSPYIIAAGRFQLPASADMLRLRR